MSAINREGYTMPTTTAEPTTTDNQFLTRTEVAQLLRVSCDTVDRLPTRDPAFPRPRKAGRRVLYARSELLAYLGSQ